MSVMRRVLATVLLLVALGACDEDSPSDTTSESLFPDLLTSEREACENTGGRWATAATEGAFTCYRDLPDAHKSCQSSQDCRGQCLARSRTCTPVEPFFGCLQVLSASGLPQTVCVE